MLLRELHIVASTFWAGAVFFMISFILPAVRKAGPDGKGFMKALMGGTKVLVALPMAGLATIASGFALFMKDMGGMGPEWAMSRTGMAYGIGAVTGIIALVIGAMVSRPASLRLVAMGDEIAAVGGTASPTQVAEMQALQGTMARALRTVAWLLTVALVAMVAARNIYG